MNNLNLLKDISEPIFYVANDVVKGIGLEDLLPNYHIICLDDHPLVDYLLKQGTKVFCLERELKQRNTIFRSTSRIIDHPLAIEYIKKESRGEVANILFFKPSAKIDFICQKYGFKKLGNSAELNRQFEDKVLFYEKCLKEGISLPEGELGRLGELEIFGNLVKKYGLPLVIQFGRGWAGSTTFFVKSEKELIKLQDKFKGKKVKITKFIEGKTVLNNACIFGDNVLASPPAVQISAIGGLTSLPAATCGRQWPAGIEKSQEDQIIRITEKVGRMMVDSGYQGYFGLDFIIEETTRKVFLSENNARLTASVPFFTKMEIEANVFPLLAYHLFGFLDKGKFPDNYSFAGLEASEIVLRNDFKLQKKIGNSLQPGVYKLMTEKYVFSRPEYYAKNLNNEEFWLFTASQGRIVNPEIEISKADFKQKILDDRGNLNFRIFKVIKKIKEDLKLNDV